VKIADHSPGGNRGPSVGKTTFRRGKKDDRQRDGAKARRTGRTKKESIKKKRGREERVQTYDGTGMEQFRGGSFHSKWSRDRQKAELASIAKDGGPRFHRSAYTSSTSEYPLGGWITPWG